MPSLRVRRVVHTKSMTGHLLEAARAVESLACLLAICRALSRLPLTCITADEGDESRHQSHAEYGRASMR